MVRETFLPQLSDALLVNPDIGFIIAPQLMDETQIIHDNRGKAVEKYKFTQSSKTFNHPDSKLGYCGARWKDIEPRENEYNWQIIEDKLAKVRALGCSAVARIMPYALSEDDDIPQWLREMYPDEPEFPFWRIDPNNTKYAYYWSRFVREFARRYDGHPLISGVDMAIVGAWGEGGGTELMNAEGMDSIISAYIDGFVVTPLHALLHDPVSLAAIKKHRANIGFRVDCLGDMGGFHGQEWSHMLDFYPESIQNFDMADAWQAKPVVFEACWHMNDWYLQGWDIDYIVDESLKWHISSYNSKGTTVPLEWRESVERWVKRMGYRYEIHMISYELEGDILQVEILLNNSGVAPCYRLFKPVIKLTSPQDEISFTIDADNRLWLPGEDISINARITLPHTAKGKYTMALGFPTEAADTLELAIEGRDKEGYYPFGNILLKGEKI